MDPADIRDTEARVYLGRDAADIGLVDELGTESDVEEKLGELLGAVPETREFEPERGLAERLSLGVEQVAFAAGNGVATVLSGDGGDIDIELR
jgi:protease-4